MNESSRQLAEGFDNINEYYRNNPPLRIIDDLGIYHSIEVPLPAKYRRLPCSCGITHKWEEPSTFELYDICVEYKMQPMQSKICKRCKACRTTLFLELYIEGGQSINGNGRKDNGKHSNE